MALVTQFTMKSGDTGPALFVVLYGADGVTPQDLTGCTIKFNMARGGTVVVDHGAMSIVGAPANGTVKYSWGATDSATPAVGNDMEYEVTFPDTTIVTWPNDSNHKLNITAQVK